MALKDLISEVGFDEAVIEAIVAPYVRYNTAAKEIILTHAFAKLSNRAKILVYLTALQGWKFVCDDDIPADARPSEIREITGIPGGSLRPKLREFTDNHVLNERDSRYSVRKTSLHLVAAEVKGTAGDDEDATLISESARPGRRARPNGKGFTGADVKISKTKPGRKISAKTGNVAAVLGRWIDEGYFDQGRTGPDVRQRLRKEGHMVPATSMPAYLLGALRDKRLIRDEKDINGKKLWAYSTNNKASG